jgi:hypothetical protein
MLNLGDVAAGSTIQVPWNTNAVDGSSITRATDGSIRIYKDNSVTQRSSSAGITDNEDFDGVTGVHLINVDLSDNTDSGFYASGHNYSVMLVGAVIDGKTVNAFLAIFSIENRSALRPTTAGRTLDVSSGGEAGVDWANVGSPTTTNNLSGTTVKTATDVEADTQDIQARLPAALVSGRIDASVGAIAANAITAASLATDAGAELADAIWDEALSGHTTPGTAGKQLQDISTGSAPTAAAIADAVWDEAIAGHLASGTTGEALNAASSGADPTVIADTILTRQTSAVEATIKAGPLCLGAAVMKAVHKVRDNAGTLEVADSTGDYAGTNALSAAITVDAANQPIDEIGALS